MTRSADPAPVLLVEDDATLRKVFAIELQRMGFRVQAMPSAQGVLELVRKTPMDAVLLDLNLPGMPGQQLLEQLMAQDPDLPVVVCTAHGSVGVAVEAMRKGAFDFLTKPVSLDVLEQSIHRATVHAQLLRDNRRLARAAAGGAAAAVTGTSRRRASWSWRSDASPATRSRC
jgi:two-component system C4-dicarboxylate transport response regulator DctD